MQTFDLDHLIAAQDQGRWEREYQLAVHPSTLTPPP